MFDDPNDWIGRPVTTGERLLEIADPNQAELEIWLPVADAITLKPGAEIGLEVVDKAGNTKPAIKLKLALMPGSKVGEDDFLPDKLPAGATLKKALEPLETAAGAAKQAKIDPKMAPTGMLKRTNAAGDRKYWISVPKDYDPQISYAVVLWLHLPGKFADEDNDKLSDQWEEYCRENHIILVGPLTEQEGGWTPADTELVLEAVREVLTTYTVDRNRVVAHGSGNGGGMALSLGFKARDTFRGIAAHGAVWNDPPDNIPAQRQSFYIAAGDRDPVLKAIAETRNKLAARGFPVLYRQFMNRGREYLDDTAFAELIRWIDALDRL